MANIQLKQGRERSVLQRHPWIFSGAIANVQGSPEPGGIVDVRSAAGEFLARGYYNPRSQISVRLLSWREDEAIDTGFWRQRLRASIERRETLAVASDTDAYRLVFAESDGLPGLIVDRYGDWLSIQSLTLGIEQHKQELADLLLKLIRARGVYERSDVDVRSHEGLPAASGALAGECPPQEIVIREHGLRFAVDLQHGHKTGLYLDQRENRHKVAQNCRGARVLNAFSYTGGFGVYAASQGASSITSLDSSGGALRGAGANLALNAPGVAHEALEGDAFQVLRRLRDQGRTFDVVVLDPPKFAFSKRQLMAATRGYKDINMLGMQLLRRGGVLATFSCSGLVSEDLFQKIVFGASVDVQREVRILERLSQGSDHPVLLTFPEGAYLKGFLCRVE